MREHNDCEYIKVSLSELLRIADSQDIEHPNILTVSFTGLVTFIESLVIIFLSLLGFSIYVVYF